MALFGKKKVTPTETEKNSRTASAASSMAYDVQSVIVGPRLTEKTVAQGEHNVYTFNVKRSATKFQVRDAVKALYKVTPIAVNIVNKQPAERHVGSRNRTKHVPGSKKAYVYMKKGDTINLV